jgi:hypothetical protein
LIRLWRIRAKRSRRSCRWSRHGEKVRGRVSPPVVSRLRSLAVRRLYCYRVVCTEAGIVVLDRCRLDMDAAYSSCTQTVRPKSHPVLAASVRAGPHVIKGDEISLIVGRIWLTGQPRRGSSFGHRHCSRSGIHNHYHIQVQRTLKPN